MRKISAKKGLPLKERGRTPLDAAFSFIAPRPRTVREVERYLDDQQYGEYEVQQTIERLLELNYLNDEEYAKEFVRTRLNTKPISKAKLFEQLLAHELPRDVINAALSNTKESQDMDNAILLAKKFVAQYDRYPPEEREQRLIRRLMGRGFTYETAREAFKEANK